MPDNLGWEITPADLAEINKHSPQGVHSNTPRMLEPCNDCGHPRRMHDAPGPGEHCMVCAAEGDTDGLCVPLGHPNHPQKRGF
jgi:hypothetical protein